MSLRPRLRIATILLAGVLAVGVTGCSAPFGGDGGGNADAGGGGSTQTDQPGDDGQSVADACSVISDTITDATAEFDDLSLEDPGAVVDAMNAAAKSVADASSQITNDDVAALLPDLEAAFASLAEALDGVAEGDLSQAQDLEGFTGALEQFQDVCAS